MYEYKYYTFDKKLVNWIKVYKELNKSRDYIHYLENNNQLTIISYPLYKFLLAYIFILVIPFLGWFLGYLLFCYDGNNYIIFIPRSKIIRTICSKTYPFLIKILNKPISKPL